MVDVVACHAGDRGLNPGGPGPDSANGRPFASGVGCRGFNTWPRHTKGVKMVPVATLLGAQHYLASTGSPLTLY